MLKQLMNIGALTLVLGFTGLVLCLPFAVDHAGQILTAYREEFNKTELVYETESIDINQIRFLGDVDVRLQQSEDEKIRIYRVSKRANEDGLNILRTKDAERSYLNITGSTEKYGGAGIMDWVFTLVNDRAFEEITVHIPKTVEISASSLNGDLLGLLQVEYLNSYAGTLVETEEVISLEEIRQNHLAIEENVLQYEYDLETLAKKVRAGTATLEDYDEGRVEQVGNISYEVRKVVRMLASHYQLTQQHAVLIMDSVDAYLARKYQMEELKLRLDQLLREAEGNELSQDALEEQKELEQERQECELALKQAEQQLTRYEQIYLGGFDLLN